MGYNTDYDVTIFGFSSQDEAEFFEFKEMHKESGAFHNFYRLTRPVVVDRCIEFALPECKWYEWDRDLKQVSKRYPHLVFEVEAVGEDFPDIWKARVQNGKSEKVKAQITYPAFKEIV